MKYFKNILIFVAFMMSLNFIFIDGIKADTGDDITVVEMVSPKIIPGSTVVPIEIKIDSKENSMTKFMRVQLEMRWNSGVIQYYDMTDNGENGDKVSGDRVFTTLISADSSLGENKAIVNIGWENSSISYPVEFLITTQQFPTLFLISDVEFIGYENLENLVGFLKVEINGTPYEVIKENINVSLYDNNGESVEVSLVAKNRVGLDQDYEFFITSAKYIGDNFKINSNLQMDFFGKYYESPVQQVSVYKDKSNLRNIILGFTFALGIILAGLATYLLKKWRSLPRPHGFLLNSERDFVVDFSTIKRNLIMKVLYKNKLLSGELKKHNLEGINLQFYRSHIIVKVSDKTQSTIRLNGRPISESSIIQNESSIGYDGKLFFVNCSEEQLEFPVKSLTAREAV
ncbi:MAG: hypothetical protein CL906_03715 [Dehalococcoidia bacterium]|nr:hypothetical protein [Dehalococcoidia bacterium]|tara:strand:+ start:1827 stop:3026 length:1200 start_codon:yes stop_codon:yes gene_type:complete